MNDFKKWIAAAMFIAFLAFVLTKATGCTKTGSSGVVDGTRWNADAVQMVKEAQR